MSEVAIIVGSVAMLVGTCCLMATAMCIRDATSVTVQVVRNPVVVTHGSGSDEPEDPVDFNSNPKSSATSLGS